MKKFCIWEMREKWENVKTAAKNALSLSDWRFTSSSAISLKITSAFEIEMKVDGKNFAVWKFYNSVPSRCTNLSAYF